MLSNNPKQVLRSMPAGTVKKVEVITDPGARYDAEGVSGILNIITKNSDFEGYKTELNTVVMNKVKVFGGYTTMKFGKLVLSADYSYSHYNMRYRTTATRRQFYSTDEALLRSDGELRVKTPGHYGALESSYELDSLNLISISASIDAGRDKANQSTLYNMSNSAGDAVYSYDQLIRINENWGSASAKADFQHRFKHNPEELLTLSYQYDYSPRDVNQNLDVSNKQGASSSLQYLSAFNHQIDHEVSLWKVLAEPITYGVQINGGTAKKLSDFRLLMESFIERNAELSAEEIAQIVVRESGIYNLLLQDNTLEGETQKENIDELLKGITEFCELRQEEGQEHA